MIIEDNIEFDSSNPLLSKQSEEFKSWFNSNINSKVTDKTTPDSFDKYERPISFSVDYNNNIHVKIKWIYIFECIESWACKDYELEINLI